MFCPAHTAPGQQEPPPIAMHAALAHCPVGVQLSVATQLWHSCPPVPQWSLTVLPMTHWPFRQQLPPVQLLVLQEPLPPSGALQIPPLHALPATHTEPGQQGWLKPPQAPVHMP